MTAIMMCQDNSSSNPLTVTLNQNNSSSSNNDMNFTNMEKVASSHSMSMDTTSSRASASSMDIDKDEINKKQASATSSPRPEEDDGEEQPQPPTTAAEDKSNAKSTTTQEDSSALNGTATNATDTTAAKTEPPASDASASASEKAKKAEETIFNSKISFPLNLTRMLEAVDDLGYSHIVHWAEDELSFVIVDIDEFLKLVLPKFFKASEKTKIRSFYRKLNRWGFSMSRKNANNPNNVWHHPDFHRTSAVAALKDAMDTGKAADFLNMSSISRGKKRRSTDEVRGEDFLEALELATGNSGAFAAAAMGMGGGGGGGDDDTITTLDSTMTSLCGLPSDQDLLLGLSARSRSFQGIAGGRGGLANIASMPSLLPSQHGSKNSLENINKRWKIAHSLQTVAQHQQNEQRRLLSQNFKAGGAGRGLARGSQSAAVLSSALSRNRISSRNGMNATFEPIQEGPGQNAMFDLSALGAKQQQGGGGGGGASLNPLMGLMASSASSRPSEPMNNVLGGASSSNPLMGLMASSRSSAPSNNVLTMSAQQMLLGSARLGGIGAVPVANRTNTMTTPSSRNNPFLNGEISGSNNAPLGISNTPMSSNISSNATTTSSATMSSNNNPFQAFTSMSLSSSSSSGNNNPFLAPLQLQQQQPNNSQYPSRQQQHTHRHLLQTEMTQEEDNELTAFLGRFAGALPPPQEGDEDECIGEPDPLPTNRRNNI